MSEWTVKPCELRDANAFIGRHHRHNKPVVGHRFSIALFVGANLTGVAIVGRPVARMLQDGVTAEVTRLCVLEGAPKGACSCLYRACWRAWSAMGGKRLVTYTISTESGSSLKGAGFTATVQSKGGEWGRPSRQREAQPANEYRKQRWEIIQNDPFTKVD